MTTHSAEIFAEVYATLLVAFTLAIKLGPSAPWTRVVYPFVVGPPLIAIALLLVNVSRGSKPDANDGVWTVIGGAGLYIGFFWIVIQKIASAPERKK